MKHFNIEGDVEKHIRAKADLLKSVEQNLKRTDVNGAIEGLKDFASEYEESCIARETILKEIMDHVKEEMQKIDEDDLRAQLKGNQFGDFDLSASVLNWGGTLDSNKDIFISNVHNI